MNKIKISPALQEEYRSVLTPELKIGIVLADFNPKITHRLLLGALEFLHFAGLQSDQVLLYLVPGALEIPLICADLCQGKKVNGIVALGAVIRGKTFHFEIVCMESARGLMDVSLRYHIPIGNSILTCNTHKQALDRSGDRENNKGWAAAKTVLDILKVQKTLSLIKACK